MEISLHQASDTDDKAAYLRTAYTQVVNRPSRGEPRAPAVASPRIGTLSGAGIDQGFRRAPGGGAPNLEDVTLKVSLFVVGPASGSGQWEARLTTYPDGTRVSVYERPRRGSGSGVKPMRTEGERFEASVRRSRSVVRHKARCLAVMYLWTFTKRGKFSSRDDLWLAWREFERMALKRFGARWRYVAVPELHSDGVTWHLHVAVAEWFDVSALRVLWYRALGGTGAEQGDATPGSVNAKDFRRRGGARRIWSYIAKYVGKGVSSSEPFRRSFSTSKGIRPLGVSVLHATWKCDLWFALEALSAELRGRFRVIGLWRAKILDGVSVGWFECAQ